VCVCVSISNSGDCMHDMVGGSVTKSSSVVKMPAPIERCVRKQNVLYLHNRNQFSAEYFRFMRRLLLCNIPHGQPTGDEKLVRVDVANVISFSQSVTLSNFIVHDVLNKSLVLRPDFTPVCHWQTPLYRYSRHLELRVAISRFFSLQTISQQCRCQEISVDV